MPVFPGPGGSQGAVPMFLADLSTGQYPAPAAPATAMPVFVVDPSTGAPTTISGSIPTVTPPATISAAGTDQGTAAALTALITVVTSVPASAGVMIATTLYQIQVIVNAGANTLSIYPRSGMAFGTASANAAIQIDAGQAISLIATSGTQAYVLSGSPWSFG
jgi:hypothetical protein